MSFSNGSAVKVYELNDRVLCRHTDNVLYPAQVVDVTTSATGSRMYTIHYEGWNNRFDEKFEQSTAQFLIRPLKKADYEEAKVYELNERVLCSHTDKLWYDAKVVGVKTTETGARIYKIHYQGWNVRFDEEFEERKVGFRIRKFNEEDYAKAKEERRAAKEKAKKPQKKDRKSAAQVGAQ